MKNPKIAMYLKYYRKMNNLSVAEVSDILRKHNINAAIKTIYGWENGQSQPDADTFMLLCDIYNIENILETFGYVESEQEQLILSDKEKELIKSYRNHPEMHDAINRLLEMR